MSVTLNGTSGLVFSDGTIQGTAGAMAFRNRIINGDMRIAQRGTAAVTVNDSDNLRFPVDRTAGIGHPSAGVFTLQQSTVAPVGFNNSVLATVTTTSTPSGTQVYSILQNIEGFNVDDLGWGSASAQPVALSFWVRSSVTGTFGGALRNSDVNRSYPFSYTISAANTFEFKTITIPGDTAGTWLKNSGIGIRLNFSLGGGSDRLGTAGAWNSNSNTGAIGQVNLIATSGATLYITGVQLEKAAAATSFEQRPIGTELALCQRYFQTLVLPARYVGGSSGTTTRFGFTFAEMRSSPTCVLNATFANNYSPTGNDLVIWGLGATARTAPTSAGISSYGRKALSLDLNASLSSGVAYELGTSQADNAASILMSSEL
jgi:hypothetical protein